MPPALYQPYPMQPSASVSVTPILDLIEPLPAKRTIKTRYILLGVLIGLLGTGLLIALHDIRWPEFLRPVIFFFREAGWALRFWDRQFLFGGLVALWIAFMLSVVIHELGHFVVGRAVGLRLHTLQLGPFRFSFEFGNLRVRIVPAIVMGGYAAMHIRTCARLRRKLAKFVFAGPGANLVCGVLALTLVRTPRFLPSVRVWSTLAPFGLISLFCCGISLLPIRSRGGLYTDGTRLLLLRRASPETLRWYAIMGIGMQQQAGRRARDWNRRWVTMASRPGDHSWDALLGAYLAYASASDRKDEPAAAASMEACLSLLPPAHCHSAIRSSTKRECFRRGFAEMRKRQMPGLHE